MRFKEVPQVFGNKIIVKVDKPDQTTESGIIITGAHEPFATGTVASVPVAWTVDQFFDEDEEEKECFINVGDHIVFKNYFANLETFSVGDDKYIFLDDDQVLAKL